MNGSNVMYSIEHTPLWRMVTNQLRALILSGELPAGSHLVETELADKTGVSRGPVRQALAQLEQEGFVVILPRQGTFVAELTAAFVSEKYELRRLLEIYAVRRAAENATPEDLDALRRDCDVMARAVSAHDIEGFYRGQYAFHRRIVDMAGMQSLSKLWDIAGMGIGSLMMLNLYYSQHDDCEAERWASNVASGSLTGHQDMVNVLASGDAARVAETMRKHLDSGESSVLQALERAKQVWAEHSADAEDPTEQRAVS